jgi:peptidoglycan biosynthesis protein MviN/MurJ (putative lipid II flippase)
MGLLASVAILLSFTTQWLTIRELGATAQADALFAGLALAVMCYDVLAGSLAPALVPMLASESAAKARDHAVSLAWLFGLVLLVLLGALAFSAGVWVPWTVPGFSTEGQQLAIWVVRLQLVAVVLTSMSAVLYAFHQACGRSVRAECAGAGSAAVALGFLAATVSTYGINAAASATVVRAVVECAWLAWGVGLFSVASLDRVFMRDMLRRVRFLVASACWHRSDLVVDRFLSSMAPSGELSILHIGRQIQHAVTRVMNRAIAVPLLPELSRLAAAGDANEYHRIRQRRLRTSLAISACIVAAQLAVGQWSLAILFESGGFTAANVDLLFVVMLCLAGVIVCEPAVQILSAGFYGQGDTRTPSWVGFVCYTGGVALRYGGFCWWGVRGLALGISCYYLVNALALAFLMSRRKGVPEARLEAMTAA